MTEEGNKKKIFITKLKPFVKTAGQISAEREKKEAEEKIEKINQDIDKMLKDTKAHFKPKGFKKFLYSILSLVILFLLINLIVFNVWAFGTMLKSIIGWFS